MDTNILIDILEAKRPNHHKALELINFMMKNQHKMVISESSISDIIYVCRNSDKLSKIIEVIEDFTFDSSIIIATYGQQVIRNTCGLYKRQAGDFEDYLQYFCAESQDCAAIYTMDKDFPRMRIQVREYE